MIELKTMTNEELLDRLFAEGVMQNDNWINTHSELLSRLNRLEEVEKENKELKEQLENVPKECEVCPEKKQLRKQMEDLGAERDNAMVAYENLKCCGNCKHSDLDDEEHLYCLLVEEKDNHRYSYCDSWQSDNLTREERK